MPPKRLSRPQLHDCGRDRSYLSRPQICGREKHTFLRRGIPRPPIFGREKPNIVVVKNLISSSDRFLFALGLNASLFMTKDCNTVAQPRVVSLEESSKPP